MYLREYWQTPKYILVKWLDFKAKARDFQRKNIRSFSKAAFHASGEGGTYFKDSGRESVRQGFYTQQMDFHV